MDFQGNFPKELWDFPDFPGDFKGFRQVASLQQSERLAERRAAQQLHEARLEMAETRRQQEILSLEMQEAVPGIQRLFLNICYFFFRNSF